MVSSDEVGPEASPHFCLCLLQGLPSRARSAHLSSSPAVKGRALGTEQMPPDPAEATPPSSHFPWGMLMHTGVSRKPQRR